MAKKAAKQRKSAETKEVKEDAILGTVSIPVQASVDLSGAVAFNEIVIEWVCLGLTEEPDSVQEISGNSFMLDKKRAPRTDEEGLHIFLDPPVNGGRYGFQFVFTYNEASEARSSTTPTDEERAKEAEKEAA